MFRCNGGGVRRLAVVRRPPCWCLLSLPTDSYFIFLRGRCRQPKTVRIGDRTQRGFNVPVLTANRRRVIARPVRVTADIGPRSLLQTSF
jgi:hypothetical protein